MVAEGSETPGVGDCVCGRATDGRSRHVPLMIAAANDRVETRISVSLEPEPRPTHRCIAANGASARGFQRSRAIEACRFDMPNVRHHIQCASNTMCVIEHTVGLGAA